MEKELLVSNGNCHMRKDGRADARLERAGRGIVSGSPTTKLHKGSNRQ